MKFSRAEYLIPSSPRITTEIRFSRQLTVHQKLKNVIKATERTLTIFRMCHFGATHGWKGT